MTAPIILASGSSIRAKLLKQANVPFECHVPRVDEENLRAALLAEQASPRDVADALAEIKALRISDKHPGALVLGCDQVLEQKGRLFSKPTSRENARDQLLALRGEEHRLLAAVVIAEDGRPIWRHVGVVRLRMRQFSDAYLDAYLDRNWPGIQHSVGAYKLEEEGVRLMSQVQGDYFSVLGLPLVEILTYLADREAIAS